MITINGYTPKEIYSPSSASDSAKILEARNFLISFITQKINASNEILDYKINYTVDKGIKLEVIRKRVTFQGGARRIQEECIRLVENSVDDALRFSELLMRCALYDQERSLDLTIYDGAELHEYLEIYALNKCRVERINYDLEFETGIKHERR